MVACVAMVFGIAFWLGDDEAKTEQVKTEETSKTAETLQAPLNAEQLAAYQVTMTNDENPVAVITTNLGQFELELFEDMMPITAGNFIKLTSEGFYNGVKFHRVIDGFMIQSGDPITKTEEYLRYGTGGSDKIIPDEHIKGEYLTNIRGTIAMANSGPASGSSQFFINVTDNIGLDFDKPPMQSKHPVFGRVLAGMDVVDKITTVEVNQNDMPLKPVIIEKIEIRRN